MANRKPLIINNGGIAQLQAADILDVSHDSLPDFVANEHVDHSGVTLTAGDGLTGGGTIETTRTLDLEIAKLSTVTIVSAGDYVPFEQISPSVANKKITFANFESLLNHDNLTGFVANEHIDHSSVLISSGSGLSGGGDITANRTLALSHLGLESLVDPNGDRILFWDDSAGAFKWLTVSNYLTLSGTDLTCKPGYYDRGSVAVADWTLTNFTMDSTWRDFDISSIVPAGAYAALIEGNIHAGTTAGVQMYFRKKGHTGAWNSIRQFTNGIYTTRLMGQVAVDSNRYVQYYGHSALTIADIVIRGWWI